MKNGLDEQYIDLLKDILENGIEKNTRNGKTLSVFGRSIRYKFKDGKFPLLTTKRMPFKTIVTELLWFLRGDTNIKFLVDNGCHIWDGDAYKRYYNSFPSPGKLHEYEGSATELIKITKEEFINKIKTDDVFAFKWGSLGKIYGYQWRNWDGEIDQISELIKQLKDNPDSRRMVVNAWAVHDLPKMVLPPCHYGFQVYTRELSYEERCDVFQFTTDFDKENREHLKEFNNDIMNDYNTPTRAISLMWNQRSVDVPLGLPFNIASYGLLLKIIAKTVNMVPDELIGNLGDCHIYENQIDGIKEQIGRELNLLERIDLYKKQQNLFEDVNVTFNVDYSSDAHLILDEYTIPKRTREPYPLPTLNINTEFWPTENGSCGEGPLDAIAVFNSFNDENFCKCLLEEDIQLGNYQSHPFIKMPLSN